jgi:hypothetical protein
MCVCIFSRVYGCVTNNMFWIGWLDLLPPSLYNLLFTINYKNSQSIFSRTLLPWLSRAHPILVLVLWLTPLYFVVLYSLPSYNSSIRKTRVTCQECVFIGSLLINGCPTIVESVISGMCFPNRCVAVLTWVVLCTCMNVCMYLCMCVYGCAPG